MGSPAAHTDRHWFLHFAFCMPHATQYQKKKVKNDYPSQSQEAPIRKGYVFPLFLSLQRERWRETKTNKMVACYNRVPITTPKCELQLSPSPTPPSSPKKNTFLMLFCADVRNVDALFIANGGPRH